MNLGLQKYTLLSDGESASQEEAPTPIVSWTEKEKDMSAAVVDNFFVLRAVDRLSVLDPVSLECFSLYGAEKWLRMYRRGEDIAFVVLLGGQEGQKGERKFRLKFRTPEDAGALEAEILGLLNFGSISGAGADTENRSDLGDTSQVDLMFSGHKTSRTTGSGGPGESVTPDGTPGKAAGTGSGVRSLEGRVESWVREHGIGGGDDPMMTDTGIIRAGDATPQKSDAVAHGGIEVDLLDATCKAEPETPPHADPVMFRKLSQICEDLDLDDRQERGKDDQFLASQCAALLGKTSPTPASAVAKKQAMSASGPIIALNEAEPEVVATPKPAAAPDAALVTSSLQPPVEAEAGQTEANDGLKVNDGTEGTQEAMEDGGVVVKDLPSFLLNADLEDLVGTTGVPVENLDTLLRLCLMDENFPGFCASVEKELLQMSGR